MYGKPAAPPAAATGFTPKPAAEEAKVKEEDIHDPADAVIAPGTKCKRPSCGKEYVREGSREEECIFHSGTPVFHEGSKVRFAWARDDTDWAMMAHDSEINRDGHVARVKSWSSMSS